MTEQTQPSAGPEPTATSETEPTSAIPQTPAGAPAETTERLVKADDEAADQGTAEGIVTDGGAAHARQGRQAGEQAKQRSLQNVDSHKRQTTFLCVVREARRAPVT